MSGVFFTSHHVPSASSAISSNGRYDDSCSTTRLAHSDALALARGAAAEGASATRGLTATSSSRSSRRLVQGDEVTVQQGCIAPGGDEQQVAAFARRTMAAARARHVLRDRLRLDVSIG